MSKIQVFMLEENSEYVSKLLSFLGSTHFQEKFHFQVFTNYDLFIHEIQKYDHTISVVISDQYYDRWKKNHLSVKVIWLTDQMNLFLDNQLSENQLFRYQPMEHLFQRLYTLCQDISDTSPKIFSSHMHIISFFSSVGHSGKTITCLSLARQLASQGKKVIVLSLEDYSTMNEMMLWISNHSLSNLLYYLRQSSEAIHVKLRQYIIHDNITGIDYIPSCLDERELQELQETDLELLLHAISTSCQYDYFLLDLSSHFHLRTKAALSLSHSICWILLDDFNCYHKTKSILKDTPDLSKVEFVVNKYTGHLKNDYSGLKINFSGFLPYIPEWKNTYSAYQFRNIQWFDDQVIQFFSDINLKISNKYPSKKESLKIESSNLD